jgi:hypothetical protein
MHEKRWTGWTAPTRLLPFQDWRWLVTRPVAVEKPIACARQRCKLSLMPFAVTDGDRHSPLVIGESRSGIDLMSGPLR